MSSSPALDREMLDCLAAQWRVQGAPLIEHLQPGLSDEAIDRLVAPLGLRLPTEARVWWRWHDGAPGDAGPPAQRAVGSSFEFLPLAEAVEKYRLCRDAAMQVASTPGHTAPFVDPDYWWAPHWFPITSTGYGAVVACDCSVFEGEPTPIRTVWWAGRENFPEPVSGSFGQVVAWWIDALDNRVWRYDQGRGEWQVFHERLDDPGRELTRLV